MKASTNSACSIPDTGPCDPARTLVALRANPALALLLGDAGAKGDALTHPRLSLIGHARFLDPEDRLSNRAHGLHHHPKALVYVDLPDFAFVALDPVEAMLNGGFGSAYDLGVIDLT